MSGAVAVRLRLCADVMQLCAIGVIMQYSEMNEQQIMETVANTDLRETCGYVQSTNCIYSHDWRRVQY